ncbi:hypothetical protein PIB30_069488 [Stylosanthes scabra]|uniref:Transposase (putative) gypsy type domain-containing protein n=1 Tax=Stylosanthes scabra TaxID=79078 RepID=A0ABU6QMR0_9FABA|nr:hypothetical protein [Stylosanthes scabra]
MEVDMDLKSSSYIIEVNKSAHAQQARGNSLNKSSRYGLPAMVTNSNIFASRFPYALTNSSISNPIMSTYITGLSHSLHQMLAASLSPFVLPLSFCPFFNTLESSPSCSVTAVSPPTPESLASLRIFSLPPSELFSVNLFMARRVIHVLPQVVPECCEWVDVTVLGAKSVVDDEFIKYLCEKYRVVAPGPEDRACYVDPEGDSCIFVYEPIFTKVGVRVPFSEFEIEVLNGYEVVPSQIHPNSWGFIRAYEVICREFRFPTSLGVFHHLFKLTKPFSKDKQQWLSFRANQGRKVFEMNEESVRDFKNLYLKVVSQPGSTPFWINREGEYRFPLTWNEEWVNPRVERKELSEPELLFLDALSECWGKKDNHLPTRLLLTQSSTYIQNEILGIMSGKSNAYDRFKAHLLSKSKRLTATVGSNSGASKSVSAEIVLPTSSGVPDSGSGKDTSATPSPSILSSQEVDNSNQDLTQTRKRKTFEPKYSPINSKEFDHVGFAQEYLVGGNNKIPMDGENFMKNLEFVTRSSIKAAAICQAAQNKLKGYVVVPEGEVELLRVRVRTLKTKKWVIEGEKFELSSKVASLEARLALEAQEVNASKELEKYRKLYAEFKLKIENQRKLESDLQFAQDLCDKFSNDALMLAEEVAENLKEQVQVLLLELDVNQIGPDHKVVDGVIVRPEPAADEQNNPEEPAVEGSEQIPASEGSPVTHPTMADPLPTPPFHGI